MHPATAPTHPDLQADAPPPAPLGPARGPLLVRALLAALMLLAALWSAPRAEAAGTPNLSLSITTPAGALVGDDVDVTLRASTPAASAEAYDLSYRVVLPGGSSYVSGSAGAAAGEPLQLTDQPLSGQTTLLWKNVTDLAGGTSHDLRFKARPSTSTYGVNVNFTITADAYANADPRYPPPFTSTGQHDTGNAHPATASDTGRTSTTQMRAMTVTESATNQPGGKLLRGVHDHQSIITLTVRGTSTGYSNSTTLDHYLPPGLEYLGCGGAGTDHTTSAATYPGHAEEYAGAGAITVPAVSGCQAPVSVTTGTFDPPGAQPSGTYTRVRWSIGTLLAGNTLTFPFAVAIPLRSNTQTWTGATPAASGAQAANLDNNGGPEITGGTVLTDTSYANGMYLGLVATNGGQDSTRTAEDLRIGKSSTSSALVQGATTQWSLDVATSEYRSASNLVVSDTVPDGLCPLESGANLAQAPNDPSDAECDPGADPSDPYASAQEQTDGSYALTWDQSTVPAFAELGPSATRTITYSTRTRSHYQEGFADAAPVLAGDAATNAGHAAADARVICGGGSGPLTCPGGAPTGNEVDHDGALTTAISDDATATLTAASGSADKQVALSGTNCTTATYSQAIPSYSPGDRICWLTHVDFPSGVDTSATQVRDFLPAGLSLDTTFGAGGDETTANDTVGASTFDASAATPGPGGALAWTLPSSYTASAGVFEHRISTRLELPTGGTDGMLVENLFKASVGTTQGTRVALRDTSNVQLRMPVLALTERITAVDGTLIAPTATRTIRGGEVLTYRLQVTNSGGRAAEALEAWDRLPAGLTCADVISTSAGGACSGGIVTFGKSPAVGPNVAATGGTADLTFELKVPTTIEVGQPLTTTSGVRQYQTTTNLGSAFTYVPASNIDSTLSASANVPAVGSAATITGALPTITETRSTSLTEAGNNDTQATIGETVTYTVSATVPAGLTVREVSVTDVLDARHTYVSGTLQQTSGPAMTLGLAGSTFTLALPTSWTAPTGTDTTFTFTFDALVADTSANTRGGPTLTNQAVLHWTPFGTANGGTQTNLSAPQQGTVIVEPALTLTKTVDVGTAPVLGGDIVQYTVTLGTSSGTAHESTLVDHVPADITPLNTAGDPISDGESTLSGGVWNLAARTITFTPSATIVAGTPDVFTYRAKVNIPVTSGAHLTNTVNATTTSLPGVVAAERTSGSTFTAGYTAANSVTLNVKTASVTKTSDVSTRTPGEKILYTVDLTLPPNIDYYDVYVKDVLPDSVDFDAYEPLSAASCLSGCTPGSEPTIQPYTTVTNGNGTITAAWDLGDLGNEPTTRTIRLQYKAHLRTTHRSGGTNVVRGQLATNSVNVSTDRTDKVTTPFDAAVLPSPSGGFDDVSASATRSITVVEPGVTLDKQITKNAGAFGQGPITIHDGDQLGYKLVITNNGNAPLYDVAVRDTPDAGLRNVTLASGLTTTANTDGFTAGDPQMTWLIPGPIAAGGTAVLQYTADLPVITSMTSGQHLDNTAQVTTSWGVAEATRTADGFLYRQYATAADSTRANYDAPNLTFTKTTGGSGYPDSAQAEVGQSFPWRITVTNTSATETATDLTIHDTLPPDWRLVSGSAALSADTAPPYAAGGAITPTITADPAGDQLTFSGGFSLAPGGSRVLTYSARPLLAAATTTGTGAGNPHVNTASATVKNSVGATGDGGGLFQSSSDTAQAILAVPTLGVDVTPDLGSGIPGNMATFTVHVTNSGAVPMSNVTLQATMPSQASYDPALYPATASPTTGFAEQSASANAATWTIASIAAGASYDLTVPFVTSSALATGTVLQLSVVGTSDQTTGTVTDDGDITLTRSADLAASISATPSSATAGTTLTYDVAGHNNGPSDAKDVTLTLPLPSTVTFQSAPAGCTLAAGTVTCLFSGDLAPGGDVSAAIVTTVNASATGNANATVTVDSADADLVGANDTANVAVPIGTSADLRLSAIASASAIAHGANVTLTFQMVNDGPSDAAAAQLVATLPAGLTYLSDDGSCATAGQTITCPAATLAALGSRTVHVVARGDVTGLQTTTAAASTATTDPATSNNSASVGVTVQPAADLQLTMSAPATLPAGATMTVGLTLTNHGPDAATGVSIAATLPNGTVFAGGDAGCTAAGQLVTCTVPTGLANGASAARSIQVTVPTALGDQHLTTTAAGSATQVDTNGATASATTVVGPSADLSVTAAGADEAVAGQQAPLTVTVSNAGPSAATNVVVTDTLPDGVTLKSVTPPAGATCSVSGQVITCTIASLAAGQSAQISLVVDVPAGMAGGRFTNRVQAASSTPDPNGANATADRETAVVAPVEPTPAPAPVPGPAPGPTAPGPTAPSTVVTPAPQPAPTEAPEPAQPPTKLKISVKGSTTKLRGGSTLTYTIRIKNTGKNVATALRICTKLGQSMSFPKQKDGFISGAELCFRTKRLERGKVMVQKVKVRVSKRARKKALLSARASVESDNAKTVSAAARGRVVTDGRVSAESVKGFTG